MVAHSATLEFAEDATAEAFQRAWAKWPQVSRHPAPTAWVTLTATNLLRDEFRRDQRKLKLLPKLAEPEAVDSPEVIDPQLLANLRQLPERQREVIALRVLLDLSPESTAQTLQISVGSVGTHLSRALATLRNQMSNSLSNKD